MTTDHGEHIEVPLEEFSKYISSSSSSIEKKSNIDNKDPQRQDDNDEFVKKRSSSRLHVETVLSQSRSERVENEFMHYSSMVSSLSSSSSSSKLESATHNEEDIKELNNTTLTSFVSLPSVPSLLPPPPPPPIILFEKEEDSNETNTTSPLCVPLHPTRNGFWEIFPWTSWPFSFSSKRDESVEVVDQPVNPPNHSTIRTEESPTIKPIDMERTPSSSSSNATSVMTDNDVVNNDSFEWPIETSSSSPAQSPNKQRKLSNEEPKQQPAKRRKSRVLLVVVLVVLIIAASIAIALSQSANQSKSVSAASIEEGGGEASPVEGNVDQQPSSPSIPNPAATTVPTRSPVTTKAPTEIPTTASPTEFVVQEAVFGAVGDVPYTQRQQEKLRKQILDLDGSTIDFLVHVGDIRNAEAKNGLRPECVLEDYEQVAKILKRSPVPVFILMGDNDWNDCPNMDEGLEYWRDTFLNFESRHWDHSFNIMRLPGQPDTFSFVHKGVLFIGLNIVGGYPNGNEETEEWEIRLSNEVEWTKQLILDYQSDMGDYTGRVVLFAHADPNEYHGKLFFEPLADFMESELENELPILLINGDWHEWSYDEKYYGQSNFLRIMLNGEGLEPPTSFRIVSDGDYHSPGRVFEYERYECEDSCDDDYVHNDDRRFR